MRWNRTRTWLLALGMAGSAAGVDAQEVGVGLHGGRVTDEGGAVHGGLTLAPYAAWGGPRAVGRLSGQVTALGEGGWLAGAALGTDAMPVRWGPLRLAVAAEVALGGSDAGYRAASAGVSPRLQLAGAGWGVEAGPRAVLAGARAGSSSAPGDGGVLPFGQREASEPTEWRDAQGAGAGAWAAGHGVSVRAGWLSLRHGTAEWEDWTGAVALELGAATLGATVGRRVGAGAGEWASGSASLSLGRHAALLLEAGGYPSDPLMGRAPGHYASAGLRVGTGRSRPVAARPSPPRAPDGRIRLATRAHPGARVELLGDWTGWKPVVVPERRPGEFALDVALPTGTHRFLFRVDGKWRVPEGFATEPDEFGGRRAVIRVGQQ